VSGNTRDCSVIHFPTFSSGANVDLWDKDGLSPLLVAAREGHDDCVATLVELGAKIQMVDNDERSVLHYAAEYDHPKVVKVSREDALSTEETS